MTEVVPKEAVVAAPRCIAIHLPLESNPLCDKCRTPEIDGKFWRWYQVAICPQCRLSGGDMYRMITKSEAKEVSPRLLAVQDMPIMPLTRAVACGRLRRRYRTF